MPNPSAYAKPIVVQVRLDEKASGGTHDRVIRVRIKNEEGEDEG